MALCFSDETFRKGGTSFGGFSEMNGILEDAWAS